LREEIARRNVEQIVPRFGEMKDEKRWDNEDT